jgi:hypothetical protein
MGPRQTHCYISDAYVLDLCEFSLPSFPFAVAIGDGQNVHFGAHTGRKLAG